VTIAAYEGTKPLHARLEEQFELHIGRLAELIIGTRESSGGREEATVAARSANAPRRRSEGRGGPTDRPSGTFRRCVMLSDREREALDEIERRLLIEDPRHSKSFGTETRILPAPGAPEFMDRVYWVLIPLTLTFTIISVDAQ